MKRAIQFFLIFLYINKVKFIYVAFVEWNLSATGEWEFLITSGWTGFLYPNMFLRWQDIQIGISLFYLFAFQIYHQDYLMDWPNYTIFSLKFLWKKTHHKIPFLEKFTKLELFNWGILELSPRNHICKLFAKNLQC